jgi:hypothetical protein
MKKSLRNKALMDSNRLLTCDYHGEDWYTNTYIATKYPIFDGYKLKKNQQFMTGVPNLAKAVGDYEYNLAEFVTDDDGHKLISSTVVNDMEYKLNTDYYNLVMSIYPKALPYVRADGKLAPVLFKDNREDVAFIMPLYR